MKRVICWIFGHKYKTWLDGAVCPYCLRCGRCPDGCGEEDEVKKMSPKTFRTWTELSLKNYRQRKEREGVL